MADSLNGWQPIQTGSDEEYVHHNIMPEVVFEVTKPTYISLMKKALLQQCLKGATQSQNEALKDIMIWNMWPKQGFAGAEVVELSAHLAAACFNHGAVTYWLFYAKWDALQGVLPNPMCNSKRPKESGKLKSRLVRSRNTGENLWEREIKVLRRACGRRGPNLWTWYLLTTIPVSNRCVFEPQTLCFLEECGSLRAR